jgi:hypothetical protein
MKNRIFAASYQRGIELMAAGCPLDYPDALAGHAAAQREPFRAEQLGGYVESRVYGLGPLLTGYVIALRIGTDRPPGTVITEWGFAPPWPDDLISWDYEPRDIIPEGQREGYASVLDSHLMGVLNERRLLRRGYPIDGLVCGCSYQPIPESGDSLICGNFTLVDDRGNAVALRIALTVIRYSATRSKTSSTRAGRSFDRIPTFITKYVNNK